MSHIWIVSMILQWAMIVLLCAVVLSLVRQLGAMSIQISAMREEGASRGAMEIYTRIETARSVTTPDGKEFSFGGDRERPVLLVFFSPNCGSCALLPDALRELSQSADVDFDTLAVVSLPRDQIAGYVKEKGLQNVAVAARDDFPEDILPKGAVPLGMSISSDGVIAARGQPRNITHLREMAYAAQHIAQIATTHSRRKHEWGESAPYWDASQVQR